MSSCAPPNRTWQGVPQEPEPYYWHKTKANWCILRPAGERLINQVCNPSFEQDVNGWGSINGSNLTLAPGEGLFGLNALQVTPNAPGGVIRLDYGTVFGWPATAGCFISTAVNQTTRSIYICFWVKAAAGDTIGVNVNTDDTFPPLIQGPVSPNPQNYKASGEWQRICYQYRAIPTPDTPLGTQIRLGFSILSNNLAGTNEMLVDGVTATNRPVYQYFDGDTEGGRWNGDAHNAQSSIGALVPGYGDRLDFAELGLDIHADEGFGLSPVENITTNYARLDGANYQRTKQQPRVITLTGVINSCGDPFGLHGKRQQIIRALMDRLKRTCPSELILCYQMTNDCGDPISSELHIPVVYENGLAGVRRHQYEERLAIQFVAYRQPWFSTAFRTTRALNFGNFELSLLEFDYPGTEDSWPTITVLGDQVSQVEFSGIRALGIGQTATSGPGIFMLPTAPANNFLIPVGYKLVIETFLGPRARLIALPGNDSFTFPPVDVTGQIDWTRSSSLFRLVPGENVLDTSVSTPTIGIAASEGTVSYTVNHLSVDFVDHQGCALVQWERTFAA